MYRTIAIPAYYSLLNKAPVELSEMQHVLNSSDMYPVFRSFCQSEFSLENILFYGMLSYVVSLFKKEEYHKLKGSSIDKLNKLFTMFVKLDSIAAVNFDAKIVSQFKSCIKDAIEDACTKCLETALHAVEFNLQDTFSRFVHQHQYRQWKQVQEQNKATLAAVTN